MRRCWPGLGLTDDTPVRAVRGDYAQLYDWFRYLQPRVDGVGGLVSLAIDEQNNRIEYGVVSANDHLALEARLRQLGVPCFSSRLRSSGGRLWLAAALRSSGDATLLPTAPEQATCRRPL